MKVGTDGVLLGAWSGVLPEPGRILDVGAGSGLIALMLAQRCPVAIIDAIEIDPTAHAQCLDNFEHTPWRSRLNGVHGDIVAYAATCPHRYDLIVSNPPYFNTTHPSEQHSRSLARNERSLDLERLVQSVMPLLNTKGRFALILPAARETDLIRLLSKYRLHLNRCTRVKGTPSTPVKRILVEASFQNHPLKEDLLVLETERHKRSTQYQELTQAFYLND